jgi:hypothetical protein
MFASNGPKSAEGKCFRQNEKVRHISRYSNTAALHLGKTQSVSYNFAICAKLTILWSKLFLESGKVNSCYQNTPFNVPHGHTRLTYYISRDIMFVKIYLFTDCITLGEIRRVKLDDPNTVSFEALRDVFVRPLLATSCCTALRQLEDELVLFFLDEDSEWVHFVGEKEWCGALEYLSSTVCQQSKASSSTSSSAAPFSLKLKVLPAAAAAIPTPLTSLAVNGVHSLNGVDADQKMRDRAAKAKHGSSARRERHHAHSGSSSSRRTNSNRKHTSSSS